MATYILIFICAFVVSTITTAAARAGGVRFHLVDAPDGYRKVHARPIPITGGVAIYVSFFGILAALLLNRSRITDIVSTEINDSLALFVSCTIMLILGIYDDMRGLTVKWKLLFQAIAALSLVTLGYRIDAIANPFGSLIPLGFLAVPVTLFWLVTCTNVLNLIDGLDGLAGGVALIAVGTMFSTSMVSSNPLVCLFAAILAGSILGFLIFNFHPASIFLGDSGSMLLGFLFGALAMRGYGKSDAVVALFTPIIILGLPIADAFLTLLRRWINRVPVLTGDRHHVHHRLIEKGLTHREAVFILHGICLLLATAGFLSTAAERWPAALILTTFASSIFFAIRFLYDIRLSQIARRLLHSFQAAD